MLNLNLVARRSYVSLRHTYWVSNKNAWFTAAYVLTLFLLTNQAYLSTVEFTPLFMWSFITKLYAADLILWLMIVYRLRHKKKRACDNRREIEIKTGLKGILERVSPQKNTRKASQICFLRSYRDFTKFARI